MELILAGLAAMAQTVAAPAMVPPPGSAALCEAAERRSDLQPIELHDLATCLFHGHGGTRDLVRARALYRQAADRGFAPSHCALGNMLVGGLGGPTDVAAGLALCRRGAEAGEAHAQTDLGNYFLEGRVMSRDVVEARRWYLLAARQGQANAAFVLGQIYWNGDGVAKDNAEAARWWRIAHEGGRLDAAYLLAREAFARFTSAGRNNLDPVIAREALNWFDLAARSDPATNARQDAVEKAGLLRQFLALPRFRGS